jgi:lipid-binding SYLF domain-containing protein
MFNQSRVLTAVLLAMTAAIGCKTAPTSETRRDDLLTSAEQGLKEMRNADSSLDPFLKSGYGYAMFPSVGSGGLVVGGSWGRAVVFEQGKHIGFADMTQGNVGLTAGGQRFRQLIVFQDKASLDRFRSNQLTLDANLSAVALTTGAAASANYRNGVAIFVQPIGGLMVSANVGGQQFRFQPL